MNDELLTRAMHLAKAQGHVLVATADQDGTPHLAAARQMFLLGQDVLGIAEWFCPITVSNVQANPRVALVVWDPARDEGFQLVGQIQEVRDMALADGYDPALLKRPPVPQVQNQLVVQVQHALHFTVAPHNDQPTEPACPHAGA